jgi:hypothetical protein
MEYMREQEKMNKHVEPILLAIILYAHEMEFCLQ